MPTVRPYADSSGSQARLYLAKYTRLGVVLDGSPSGYVWNHASQHAVLVRIRVILASWYRWDEAPRRRNVSAWRFSDGSHLVCLRRVKYRPELISLSRLGISAHIMRDSHTAVGAALRSGVPIYEDLVCVYIELHGGLPDLDEQALLGGLQASAPEIRLAAISSLGQKTRRFKGAAGRLKGGIG